MAKSRLLKEYEILLNKAKDDFAGKYTSGTATQLAASLLSEFNIGGDRTLEGVKKGMSIVLAQLENDKRPELEAFNTDAVWNDILIKIVQEAKRTKGTSLGFTFNSISEFKQKPLKGIGKKPIFYLRRSPSNLLQFVTLSSTNRVDDLVKDLVEKFANKAYDAWNDYVSLESGKTGVAGRIPGGKTKGGQQELSFEDPEAQVLSRLAIKRLAKGAGKPGGEKGLSPRDKFRREGFKQEHGYSTTSALFAVDSLKGRKFNTGIPGISIDSVSVDDLVSPPNINWQQEVKKSGKYGAVADYFITFGYGKNPTNLKTDIANIRKQALKAYAEKIDEAAAKQEGPFKTSLKLSKPLDDQFSENAVDIIVKAVKSSKKLKNKKVTVKVTAKGLKRKKRREKVSKEKTAKPRSKTINVAVAGTMAKVGRQGRPKPKGGTKDTANVLKIRNQINAKLGSEIKRNMGRPALINRTGRFAGSAELVSLKRGPASLIGEYTYQLSPYETFENEGDKQWPAGYNPKPLISKSIRNLAVGLVDDKFTLRRV